VPSFSYIRCNYCGGTFSQPLLFLNSAPFANDECMTHVGLQPPDYSQAGPPEAQMSVAHVGSGSTRGLGYDTQEVLCKSSCSGKAFGGCSGAHSAREGHDEAAGQRQREEEEWEAAKRAMDEQDAEERNHAKKLAAQQARVVVETVEAKETEAGVEAVKKEEEADQGARVVCDTVSTAPATNQSPSTESGGFPVRMEAMALEAMSKKELVLLVQVLASPQLLQAAQLSGNPHNVAKKASKEKVRTRSSALACLCSFFMMLPRPNSRHNCFCSEIDACACPRILRNYAPIVQSSVLHNIHVPPMPNDGEVANRLFKCTTRFMTRPQRTSQTPCNTRSQVAH
jgi:hypothetical protein